jgi:hypothetical protein
VTVSGVVDTERAELNRLEMQGNDLPPHFGAWCRGVRDTNPAYVSFLPNVLHGTNGIAVNMSFWAMSRAQMADVMLGRWVFGEPWFDALLRRFAPLT